MQTCYYCQRTTQDNECNHLPICVSCERTSEMCNISSDEDTCQYCITEELKLLKMLDLGLIKEMVGTDNHVCGRALFESTYHQLTSRVMMNRFSKLMNKLLNHKPMYRIMEQWITSMSQDELIRWKHTFDHITFTTYPLTRYQNAISR